MTDDARPLSDPPRHTQRTSKEIRDLRLLLDISRAMNAEPDLDQLLTLIVDATTKVMDADRSSLFLVDHDRGELWSKIAQGDGIAEIRFPVGVGIAGGVAESRELVNIPDAYQDPRFNQAVDKKTGYRTETILCAPLLNQAQKVVGVVQVLNKRGGAFTPYDENLLTAFASQAAVAIDTRQLFAHFLEKQKIQQALEVACEIQKRLLPEEPPEIDRYDIAALSESCDETGGDYYDFLYLGKHQLGLVCGDVSGHGLGAALLMATARATLRALVDASAGSISAILKRVNMLLAADTDDEQFMTMFYGVVSLRRHHLVYANAGHDSPFYYRAKKRQIIELESTSYPLGMIEEASFPQAAKVRIGAGDILVVMTDGIWESMNSTNETFGRARVNDLLHSLKDASAREIAARLCEEVAVFRGDAPVRDDATVMVVKRLR